MPGGFICVDCKKERLKNFKQIINKFLVITMKNNHKHYTKEMLQ